MDANLAALADTVRGANADGRALRLRGGGTKDFYGQALKGEPIDTRRYAGIVDYDPTELVITARCGTPLAEMQLVQQMISRMMTDVHAARLMCRHAAVLRARRHPAAIKESTMAKYFASRAARRAADDALQIHGANGCGPGYPLERYLRDARIMEIIEGSTQVLETAIARYGYQELGG